MSEDRLPTHAGSAWFHFRTACFRLKRSAAEWNGRAPVELKRAPLPREGLVLAESRTVLKQAVLPAELLLQAGKIQNLRLAARQLNGLQIRAGEVFSFWKNLGRATRRRGFVAGRELREGCVIPNVGGGLCQLSNALYDVALQAGCTIVERHAHSRIVPGSMAIRGRDATVFWNYVDLRFAPLCDCQLRVVLNRTELVVALLTTDQRCLNGNSSAARHASDEGDDGQVESCETCGETKCFRNPVALKLPKCSSTAWLLDKCEPEFDEWLRKNRASGDTIILPLATRVSRASYGWNTSGFAHIKSTPAIALYRSISSRRLADQGAARQQMLMECDGLLADAFGRKIPFRADHLVISQNLLPHLWRTGWLGGRTFDVLMTRLPMQDLEQVLDRAAAAHPVSRTLSDFRAPAILRDAETEALAAARSWITPHAQIAALGGNRALKLEWAVPVPEDIRPGGRTVLFPASTLARKGCYEMREVARQLGLSLRLGGRVVEAPEFWRNLDVATVDGDWLNAAAVLVLPAWVEHWPRRLIRAAAAGIPVIASSACGLSGIPNVQECQPGDVDGLVSHLSAVLRRIPA